MLLYLARCFRNEHLRILSDVLAQGSCVPLASTQQAGKDSGDTGGAAGIRCGPFSLAPFGHLPSHSASSPGSPPFTVYFLTLPWPCLRGWWRHLPAPAGTGPANTCQGALAVEEGQLSRKALECHN